MPEPGIAKLRELHRILAIAANFKPNDKIDLNDAERVLLDRLKADGLVQNIYYGGPSLSNVHITPQGTTTLMQWSGMLANNSVANKAVGKFTFFFGMVLGGIATKAGEFLWDLAITWFKSTGKL